MPDPENPQGWNRYTYTINNPLKYNDPSGHCWGPLSFARDTFYSTTCNNLDMAVTIVTSPDASVGEKLFAGGYIAVEATAHAAVAVGTTVIAAEAAPVVASAATTATTTRTLAGSGTGAVVSGGTYLATNMVTGQPFDAIDFGLTVSSGAVEGGFAANFGPVSSSLFSGAAGGGQSLLSDQMHGRPVDYATAGESAAQGVVSGIFGEMLSGGFKGWGQGTRKASYGIRGEADFIDRTWLHQNPDLIPNKTTAQTVFRTTARDITYGTLVNAIFD